MNHLTELSSVSIATASRNVVYRHIVVHVAQFPVELLSLV